jgi:urease accessory protein
MTMITWFTGITMIDDGGLYRLLSWLSPGYPVGAFSYSHGLEYAVETGRVSTAEDVSDWVSTVLLQGTGRVDGVLFRESYSAVIEENWSHLDGIVDLGNAFQATSEFALETRAQGNAFIKATLAAWPADALTWIERGAVYPVAVGVACAAHAIPLETSLHGYFHAFAANLVSAAVRLVPLGQTDGQLAIAALAGPVAQAQQQALFIPLDDIGSAAPLIDLASMHHETQYTRLFRS